MRSFTTIFILVALTLSRCISATPTPVGSISITGVLSVKRDSGLKICVPPTPALPFPGVESSICPGAGEFLGPCNCLVEANFVKSILLQSIQFIFPVRMQLGPITTAIPTDFVLKCYAEVEVDSTVP